jgi:hypothetical protein
MAGRLFELGADVEEVAVGIDQHHHQIRGFDQGAVALLGELEFLQVLHAAETRLLDFPLSIAYRNGLLFITL